MVRRCVAVGLVAAVAGCGRLHFDERGSDGGLGGDGDALAATWPCPIGATAPDPLVVSGRTVRVNFLGGITNEGSVTVAAWTAVGGTQLATTTSAGNGDYALPVATGGDPVAVVTTYVKATFLTSVFVPDQPSSANVDIGPSFMGTSLAVGSLYTAGGMSRDPTRGTVFVVVQDCAGNAIDGATIEVTPAPRRILYSSDLGVPLGGATTTGATGFAWALDAVPGTTTITATKAGATFVPLTLPVLAGDYFMGTHVRPRALAP